MIVLRLAKNVFIFLWENLLIIRILWLFSQRQDPPFVEISTATCHIGPRTSLSASDSREILLRLNFWTANNSLRRKRSLNDASSTKTKSRGFCTNPWGKRNVGVLTRLSLRGCPSVDVLEWLSLRDYPCVAVLAWLSLLRCLCVALLAWLSFPFCRCVAFLPMTHIVIES